MFDAGAIQAHLDVELTQFDRKLTEAEARVKRFEDEKHQIHIEPVLDQRAMTRARQDFARLDQQITREATQRARTSQGSVLGGLFGDKTAGGRVAGGLKSAPLLLGAGLAALPAATVLGGAGLAAGGALAGGFAAGGLAAAAFASVAKPILSDALKAEQAVRKAQDAYNAALASGADKAKSYAAEQKAINAAYANMAPAQIALSKQLGKMGEAWEQVKKAEAPVVAGALQPWLRSVTDLTKLLGPIISRVAGVVGSLGSQFESLVSSPAFVHFRDFIADTGSKVLLAGGNLLISFFQALVILLPKFNPLIEKATGWIGGLGPKLLTWASSQKTADNITKFMQWFSDNGPTVGRFIESIGRAIKTLAPGLAAGGLAELQALTWFLNQVAKLPPGVAGPLTAIAGAALILAKLPGGGKVITFSVNLVGKGGAALLKWLSGGAIDIGGGTAAATEMKAAFETGGTSAALKMRAALSEGGAVAAGEEATGLAAAGAGAGKAASGGFLTALAASPGLPLIGGIIAGELIKTVGDSLNKPGSTGAAASAGFKASGAPGATIFGGWVGALAGWLGIGSGDGGAAAAVKKATEQITGDFKRQGDAALAAQGDVTILTRAITHNGNASGEAHAARAALLADMEKAGVDSLTAQADVMRYSNAVETNGARSDQARAARQRLISDILSASANSRQGNTDLSTYTQAVKDHGVKSDQARAARRRLITDLENAGLDAKTATGLVDGLGTSVKNLPAGKAMKITMTADGFVNITEGKEKFSISQGAWFSPHAAGGVIASGMPYHRNQGDDVLISAKRGEYIHRTSAVSRYGVPAMEAVNQGRAVIGYAKGGPIGAGRSLAGTPDTWPPQMYGSIQAESQAQLSRALNLGLAAAVKAGMKLALEGSGSSVLAYAMSFLHRAPYVWGGNTPAGWDCSGYVEYVLKHFGLGMPGRPTAASFQGWATPSGPVPGGLAFYGTPAHHIGFVKDGHTLLSALGRNYGTTLSALNMGDNAGYGVPPKGYGKLSAGGFGPGGVLPVGKIQELAFTLLKQRGWGNQWNAFNALEMSEAGYRLDAKNPTSPAYGMAQFIGGAGDYAKWGGSWLTAQGQLTAMLNYIADRYPSGPNQAWAFHQRNNYYGEGGPITEPVIGFGTRTGQSYTFGENGTEWVTPGGKPPGGAMIGSVTIQLPDGQSVASALSELNFWLNVAQQQGYAGVLPGG